MDSSDQPRRQDFVITDTSIRYHEGQELEIGTVIESEEGRFTLPFKAKVHRMSRGTGEPDFLRITIEELKEKR